MFPLFTTRLRHSLSLGLVLGGIILSACGGRQEAPAPAPVGRSYGEYLKQGQEAAEPPEALEKPSGKSADAMSVHFIDVGQGAATLVEFPCGAILVDTGGEKNNSFDSEPQLLAYLENFFKRRSDLNKTLDALVISHPHIDHTRSIEAVLRNFRVRNIVDNGDVQNDLGGKPQIAMHDWLYKSNQQIAARNQERKRRGQRSFEEAIGHIDISSDDVGPDGLTNNIINPIPACPTSSVDPKIVALWGMRLGRSEKGHNANDDSVVLRIDFGESSLLLAGDVELLSIAWMSKHYRDNLDVLDVDIYQVPHHGSRNSTGAAWVSYITPRVAVISMGPYGRHLKTWPEFTARSFGHPNINSVDHVLSDQHGVSAVRAAPLEVMVGKRGAWKETPSEFEARVIDRALYATGWDGHVVVRAHADGRLEVDTSGRPESDRSGSAIGAGATKAPTAEAVSKPASSSP